MKLAAFRAGNRRGMTLVEVLLAMFILLVGIVGVVAAIPTGISSATAIVFQDASLHLAHSKFDEFARDRVDPATDLQSSSAYLNAIHGPVNSSPGGNWRDFLHKRISADDGDPYEYFDDIALYEWSIQVTSVGAKAGGGALTPVHGGGADIKLFRVLLTTRRKGSAREMEFNQYMCAYDK